MYIIPQKNPSITDPNLLPIKVVLTNRADVLAIVLRIIRYLFQQGICGKNLKWSDSEETGIVIEDSFQENPDKKIYSKPIIIVSIGGISFISETMPGPNYSEYDFDKSSVFSKHIIQIQLDCRGRNKLETYRICDALGTAIFLLSGQIKKYVLNIQNIFNIVIGDIRPISNPDSTGSNVNMFQGTIGFNIEYIVNFKMSNLEDLFTGALISGYTSKQDQEIKIKYMDQLTVEDSVIKDNT